MRLIKSLSLSGALQSLEVASFLMCDRCYTCSLTRRYLRTVKGNFGVLLKFSDLAEMSRDTLKESLQRVREESAEYTEDPDIGGAKVTEDILNFPAANL